jgi:site-specific DNA recombinase
MNPVLRCAVYARFSSEKQSPLSIEDQVRKCREYAEQHGWFVLDSHIYSDEAISGATDDRFGRFPHARPSGNPQLQRSPCAR